MSKDKFSTLIVLFTVLTFTHAASVSDIQSETAASEDDIAVKIKTLLDLLDSEEVDIRGNSEDGPGVEEEKDLENISQGRSTATGCQGRTTLTTSGLIIQTPNYPQRYPANLNCEWLIEAGPNQVIVIEFSGRVRIESNSENCLYDYLDIYDGSSTQDTQLAHLCGNMADVESFTTSGNHSLLKFKSDVSIGYRGFSLIYTFQDIQQVNPGSGAACSGITELTSSTSTVTSPSYPNNYGDDSSCGFRITAPTGNLIEITFTDFLLEPESSCMFDSLTVYNGDNEDDPEIGRYCGSNSPGVVTSAGHQLFLKFVSDLSLNYRGFSFDYRFIVDENAEKESPACGVDRPQELTGEQGTFSSDGFKDSMNYADSSNCAWRVTVPNTMRAHLVFESFSLEPSYLCQYDKLFIYDGSDTTAEPLGPYCGGDLPGDITATGNVLYVVFRSDSSVTDAGFKVNFSGKDKVTPGGGGAGEVECGIPSIEPKFGRIVGGQAAVPHSWPWQVSMRYRNYPQANGWGHWCGGSIIAPGWVITAAHCVDGRDKPADFRVVIGDHNRKLDIESSQSTINLDEIIMHEDYNGNTYNNDIALFKLSSDITYTAEVSPVCLPTADVPSRQMCVTTGWGDTKRTSDNTYLQQVQVPTIERKVCNQVGWYGGSITRNMFCAGYPEGTKDSCQGDSGGPLVCTSAGRWKLYGLTSWGNGCAEEKNPGVYTRVTRYSDWIQSKTGITA